VPLPGHADLISKMLRQPVATVACVVSDGACPAAAAEAEHIWEIQIGFKERSAG